VHLRVAPSSGHVEAQVSDSGPGIPDADRERIFERFARLDPALPGSGLGLAIAQRIARQHGGDLTCNPNEHGASVTLTLPRPATWPATQQRTRNLTTAKAAQTITQSQKSASNAEINNATGALNDWSLREYAAIVAEREMRPQTAASPVSRLWTSAGNGA
jgi:Histidine kinase-, DNA gyrase B-, and HSP90-like ATPase